MVVLIILKEGLDNIMAKLKVEQSVRLKEVLGHHIVLLLDFKIMLKLYKQNGELRE